MGFADVILSRACFGRWRFALDDFSLKNASAAVGVVLASRPDAFALQTLVDCLARWVLCAAHSH